MSANLATKNAILENLRAIISTTIGYQLESLSADPDVDTTPHAVIKKESEVFEETSGQRPKYSELNYNVIVTSNHLAKLDRDNKGDEIVDSIRTEVTINDLNVGDLSVSKLVSKVLHDPDVDVHNDTLITVNYRLTIRYREL